MQEAKQNKLALLQQMIDNAERNIVAAKQIMKELGSDSRKAPKESEASQIVEGTFDGEKMVSMEGKTYPVPANYASKSKLVEGDLLKLTITEDGSFVYKKISSVETRKIIGTVMKDGKDKYYVSAEGRRYNVLLASLTYFRAKEGDEVILILPKEKVSTWAAVESIISEEDRQEMLRQEEENDAQPVAPQPQPQPQQEEESPLPAEIAPQPEAPLEQPAPYGSMAPASLPEEQFASAPAPMAEEIVPDASAPAPTLADNPVAYEENRKNAAIEDEWTPDVDELRREAGRAKTGPSDGSEEGDISDDFSA